MKKIYVRANQVCPSQNYLREDTVRYILACYKEHREKDLPPPPFVRHDPETGILIAIDGHNLLAVADFFGKEIEVYIAESSKDFVEGDSYHSDMIKKRNNELKEKFDQVLHTWHKTKTTGICNFSDLRNKYKHLWIF